MSDEKDTGVEIAGVSRRQFLQTAGLTAAAATATGAAAALLARKEAAAPLPVSNLAAAVSPAAATASPEQVNVAQLLARLAEMQAENRRLQLSLDTAQRRLAATSADVDAATAATEPLVMELEAAQVQVGLLAGLVALYEQLDDVDLGAAWETGKTAVSGAFADLLVESPLLRDGITSGQQVLSELDEHIPRLQEGHGWLRTHLEQLAGYYEAVGELLETTLELTGPILEMLQNWFREIRQWLPFGLGQRAAAVMESITNLLAQIPYTVSGLDSNVAQPLDVWLAAGSDAEVPLRKDLIRPLRDDLLPQAAGVTDKVEKAHSAYQAELAAPLETAVANHRLVRELIAQYRQEHGLT